MLRTVFSLAVLFAAQLTYAAEPEFEELFSIEGQFSMPESAAIDENGEFVYISNVNVYAKDGNGFISRVRTDGSDFQLHWLEGLDSPTGLAITGDQLFLADYDQLVEVDLESASIVRRYESPDTDPVLNDVAIAPDGTVYVSGSGSRSIYQLGQNTLEVWLHDRERLAFANGLLVNDGKLLHGGQLWTVFNLDSKEATLEMDRVNEFVSDIDGITNDGCDGFFLTSIPSDDVWWVNADGEAIAASLGPINGIDLHRRGRLLAVPLVGNSFSLYSLEHQCE